MCIGCEYYKVNQCCHNHTTDGEPPCQENDIQQKEVFNELLMEQQEQM